MSTVIGGVKIPFSTKFTLQSIVGAFSNLVGQYNFSSITVAVLLYKLEYGKVPQWALSSLNSAVYGGAVVGMLTLGYVGDLLGRRRATAITLTIMIIGGVGSTLLSWGDETAVYVLTSIFRFVTGIGVGGVWPLSATASYENDLAASGDYGQRLRNVAWTQSWQQVGSMVPFLVGLILFGTFYTRYCASQARIVMFIGALMAIVPLRQLLKKDPKQGADGKYKERELQEQFVDLLGQNPDSDDEAVDDTVTSSTINVMDLIAKVNAQAKGWELIGTCTCWFCSNFYSTGLATFVPEILERAYNGDLNLVKDYRFNAYCCIATFPTTWITILLVGRMNTKDLQLWGFALNALSLCIIAMIWDLDTTLGAVDKFTIVIFLRAMSRFGATTTTFVMPSELFSAEVRSTVNGFSAAWGMAGAFVSTMVTPIMYEEYGYYSVFFLYSASAAVGLVSTYFFIPFIDQEAKAAAVQSETRVKEQRRGAETVPLVGGTLNQMRSQITHGE